MSESQQARAWFAEAAHGFSELVSEIRPDDLDRPGLGEWTVRELIGHSGRAFSTIETYLDSPVPEGAEFLPDAVAYFQAIGLVGIDHAQIAARGKEAGRALGDHPAQVIDELADRVLALVDRTPDDAPAATALGPMRLIDYLPTRAFELTVHGLDLAYAVDIVAPRGLRDRAPDAVRLATGLAEGEQAVLVLGALTGRTNLPIGFSLL